MTSPTCSPYRPAFGTDRRVVLTHSATLHAAQSAGFAQTLAKATRALTELAGTTPAQLRLTWRIDPAARNTLETEIFGKRLLVTDHDHWTVPEVVAGYRSQNDVESGFRQLKDPHVVGFSPLFHWTEPTIRVHVFYCVPALAVAHLMRREAHQGGLDLSARELLASLAGIEETVLLYPTGNKGRPRAQRILTDTDPTQKRLFDLFGLDTYAPKR